MAMKRVGGWLNPSKTNISSSRSLTALDEPHALQEAMSSAALIINDEVERADIELSKGTSPFHKLGRSTTLFLRATLGFEKQVMEQAGVQLAEAEESASEHQRRAIRDPSTAHQSKLYPAGAEYALCHAESQLMSAVVGVLNESLTESLRGFYKLRKAFTTLHEIIEAENKYLDKYFSSSKSSLGTLPGQKGGSDTPATSSGVMTPVESAGEEDAEEEFKDAEEKHSDQPTPATYQGHLEFPDMSELKVKDIDEKLGDKRSLPGKERPCEATADQTHVAKDTEGDVFDFTTITSDPIDLFIHSGTALCFGLLQLMLSMIPPAFSRLLSIFSFRGDRENGLRLLWQATAFKDNINGAMAGLITLGFHNAAVALCDIHSREAYPEARLRALLQEMRQLYPKSFMWILEEARMASVQRNLERGVEILKGDSVVSPLKQVEALRVFETSMAQMFLHRYEECATSFIKCVDLNNWSHGLYYYLAACCYVELYRIHWVSDPAKAEQYKKKANDLMRTATGHTGKKRFMARQLPLDVFINRKIAKWTARAKTRNCDFIDAIGVSPVEEMIYFWSGFKRMGPEHLQTSLQRLAWFEDPAFNKDAEDEPVDERAIRSLLKATCLRCLEKTEEAKAMLSEHVFCYQLTEIKACEYADNWSLPVAHYEHAVNLWQEAGGQDGDRAKLQQCSDQLAKVERWESYDLEARIGLKLTTARETLRRIGIVQA